MGTDGTLGLRAIKEKAGVVLVLEPASTHFNSMPRSAIDAGLADFVAPVGELPGKLVAYLQHAPFHYRLTPGGVLLLGGSESIGGFTQLFVPLLRYELTSAF